MKKLLFLSAVVITLTTFNSCQKFDWDWHNHHGGDKSTPSNVATDWYKLQLRILLERNSALPNGVFFGYIGIGLYESVRYDIKNSISLSTKLYQMPVMPAKEDNKGYNWQVSANAALASMVHSFYTGLTPANLASIDSLENAYNQKLTPGTSSENFTRSQTFGRSIATAIYNWYLTDNINLSNAGYAPPVFPGAWIPTPPAFVNPPVLPFIGVARTYLSANLTGIVPPFPVPYSEEINSAFYKIVKDVYDVSQTLTIEQKNIALYWVDQGNGVGYTPAGHDMSLVTEAIEQTNSNLGVAAEAYAKAGIAERDGAIVCFRSKYTPTYNIIRPVSYIQKLIDPAWLPFISTPPHPEYPAAHSAVTGSVMQAVSGVLGNHVNITDHTYDFRGWAPRSFNSLFAAAEEAGISRLYGGIHYHISINAGLALAREVGGRIAEIKLH